MAPVVNSVQQKLSDPPVMSECRVTAEDSLEAKLCILDASSPDRSYTELTSVTDSGRTERENLGAFPSLVDAADTRPGVRTRSASLICSGNIDRAGDGVHRVPLKKRLRRSCDTSRRDYILPSHVVSAAEATSAPSRQNRALSSRRAVSGERGSSTAGRIASADSASERKEGKEEKGRRRRGRPPLNRPADENTSRSRSLFKQRKHQQQKQKKVNSGKQQGLRKRKVQSELRALRRCEEVTRSVKAKNAVFLSVSGFLCHVPARKLQRCRFCRSLCAVSAATPTCTIELGRNITSTDPSDPSANDLLDTDSSVVGSRVSHPPATELVSATKSDDVAVAVCDRVSHRSAPSLSAKCARELPEHEHVVYRRASLRSLRVRLAESGGLVRRGGRSEYRCSLQPAVLEGWCARTNARPRRKSKYSQDKNQDMLAFKQPVKQDVFVTDVKNIKLSSRCSGESHKHLSFHSDYTGPETGSVVCQPLSEDVQELSAVPRVQELSVVPRVQELSAVPRVQELSAVPRVQELSAVPRVQDPLFAPVSAADMEALQSLLTGVDSAQQQPSDAMHTGISADFSSNVHGQPQEISTDLSSDLHGLPSGFSTDLSSNVHGVSTSSDIASTVPFSIPSFPFCSEATSPSVVSALSSYMSADGSLQQRSHCCDSCDKRFTSLTRLRKHQLVHTDERPYCCTKCEKTFKSVTALNAHTLTHSEHRPFTCQVCQQTFAKKWTLLAHTRVHEKSGSSKMVCETCSCVCEDASTYASHIKLHTGERKWECSVCHRGFSKKLKLRKHMVVHSRSMLHRCHVCSREFRWKEKLLKHIMLHTGERPFACTVEGCSKAFRAHSDLNVHLRNVHHLQPKKLTYPIVKSDPKPNHCELLLMRVNEVDGVPQCDLCTRHFTSKHEYLDHVIPAHREQQAYVCHPCKQVFADKEVYEDHMECRHRKGEILWRCHLCPKVYSKQSYYEAHRKLHGTQYQCKICFRFSPDKRQMEYHILCHRHRDIDNDDHACTICERSFKLRFSLKNHMLKVHSIDLPSLRKPPMRKFECCVCQARFIRPAPAFAHMRKVHGLTPAQCAADVVELEAATQVMTQVTPLTPSACQPDTSQQPVQEEEKGAVGARLQEAMAAQGMWNAAVADGSKYLGGRAARRRQMLAAAARRNQPDLLSAAMVAVQCAEEGSDGSPLRVSSSSSTPCSVNQGFRRNTELLPPADTGYRRNTELLPPTDQRYHQNSELLPPTDQRYHQNTELLPPADQRYQQNTELLPPAEPRSRCRVSCDDSMPSGVQSGTKLPSCSYLFPEQSVYERADVHGEFLDSDRLLLQWEQSRNRVKAESTPTPGFTPLPDRGDEEGEQHALSSDVPTALVDSVLAHSLSIAMGAVQQLSSV